jgi:hypothetical protein
MDYREKTQALDAAYLRLCMAVPFGLAIRVDLSLEVGMRKEYSLIHASYGPLHIIESADNFPSQLTVDQLLVVA